MDKKVILLFLLIICSMKFFDAVLLSSGLIKNISYAYMALAVAVSLPYFFKNSGGFVLAIQLISASVLLSIFMAQYTWGQGLSYSPTTIPYLLWFVFFYLLNTDIEIKTIEKIILIYGMIYIGLFLFQIKHTDVVYFGRMEEFKEDRGITRVNFPGGGVFFLSCFIAINKVTAEYSRYKFLWLLFALCGIVIIVMQVTRQSIAIILFMYLVHFLRNVKLSLKIATIASFALAGYLFLNSNNPISKGLASQQKADASLGKDYIRVLESEYFLTQFTPNTISKVLGNGFYNDTSRYGKVLNSLVDNYGYYLSDVGLIEVYIVFGVFAVIGYLIILIKSITIPVPPDYMYLKYYLWMIMATSLTSDFLISYNFLMSTILALYCYQRLYMASKEEDEVPQDDLSTTYIKPFSVSYADSDLIPAVN